MRILIDQDGVLANFCAGYAKWWVGKGLPDVFANGWDMWDMFAFIPKEHHDHVLPLMCDQGFFRSLPVIEGAQAAVEGLLTLGHQLWICSTPVESSDYCEGEKKAWLREHFGKDIAKRVIFTQDKTLVHGDLLIDDKPAIHGEATPVWKHVLYTQPYNRHVTDRPRLTWANWREVLG